MVFARGLCDRRAHHAGAGHAGQGHEFDQVIVYEPAQIATAEMRGLHRLYVALTRAVSRLTVLHAEPLPPALSDQAAGDQADGDQAEGNQADGDQAERDQAQGEQGRGNLVLSQSAQD